MWATTALFTTVTVSAARDRKLRRQPPGGQPLYAAPAKVALHRVANPTVRTGEGERGSSTLCTGIASCRNWYRKVALF